VTVIRFLGCLIALASLLTAANAQVDRAALNGTVTDSTGQPVPGVNIVAVQLSTGLKRIAISSAEGTYDIPQLPVGTYSVTFSQAGFASLVIDNILQTVGKTRTLNATLKVAGIAHTIQVSGDDIPLDETEAATGGRIEKSQVQNLPLNGRNWATLSALTPTAIDTGGSNQRTIYFAGRGLDDNTVTLDGVDATNIINQMQQPYVRLAVPTDSIQEFHVESILYTSEYGNTAGGQVAVTSVSGTNQYHGNVFEYLRNDVFDAENPFDYLNPTYPKPPFHLNQFGGSIGGPIIHNKTFFYLNYEGIRQNLGQTLIGYVPTDAYRAIVAATSPALIPILNAYPHGRTNINSQVAQYVSEGNQIDDENAGMARLDQIFSDKTTLYARFNFDSAVSTVPLGSSGLYLTDRQQLNSRPMNGVVDLTHTFSTNWLNDVKFGYNHSTAYTTNLAALDTPYAISVPGFTKLNTNQYKIGTGTAYSYIDNATWVHGRHTLKFGGEVRQVQLNQGNTASGTVTYSALASFTLNRVSSATYAADLPVNNLRKPQFFAFIQDEWKATPTLTLNLGLRYEFFNVFHELNGLAVPFDFNTCGSQGFCADGASFGRVNPYDFDPRLGIAWSPARWGGNTVIRAGFGIYHADGQLDDQNLPISNEVARYSLSSKQTPGLNFPIDPFLPTTPGIVSPRDMDRLRSDEYVIAWGTSIQHQLARYWVFTMGYAGAKGEHLLTTSYINVIDPLTGQRQYPNFGQVEWRGNTSSSFFNALVTSLQRQFTSGFLFSLNYMWSHSTDDGSIGGGDADFPQNVSCMSCNWASSDNDVRHVFNANTVYQLPFGAGKKYLSQPGVMRSIFGAWQLSGIIAARTGLPVNVVIDRSSSATPDGYTTNQRPNLVPGVPLYGAGVTDWINPAAFATPANGTWGDLPRNFLRGPGIWQTDLGLQKQMQLTERLNLQFRYEVFNIFNHAEYGQPQNDVSATTFGQILNTANTGPTGTGTPRQMQFMLRLNF
jgi:Carboxypeptidase regulatory-like domain